MAEGQTANLGPESERGLACLAYLFNWITGLIILLTAKKEEKFKRWHAIQAIGLGIAIVIVYVIVNVIIVGAMVAASTSGSPGAFGPALIIPMLVWLAVILITVYMMVTAYQGKTVRLPLIAGFADKNA